jgi:hypothetical protein
VPGAAASRCRRGAQVRRQAANYCEIGGNPSVAKAAGLAKLVLSKPGVDKIAVMMSIVSNTRVDIVARGVVKACLELGFDPAEKIAIFRIPGAWEDEGFKILEKYGRRVLRPLGVDARGGAARPSRRSGMSILIDENTTFIVQGITGREAVNLTASASTTARGAEGVGGASRPGARAATCTGVPCSTRSSRRSSTTARP